MKSDFSSLLDIYNEVISVVKVLLNVYSDCKINEIAAHEKIECNNIRICCPCAAYCVGEYFVDGIGTIS